MNYDYASRIIKAAQEGKALQRFIYHPSNGWKDITDIRCWSIEGLNNPELIRIKPELKRVPVEVKDLPAICHIRFAGDISVEFYQVTARNLAVSRIWLSYPGKGSLEWHIKELPKEAEYSSDLITWHKFFKEVEVI